MVHLLLAVIYVSFISLGLPDSLLGSAWPAMHRDFGVPVSYSGIIFFIIAAGTVVSSLQSGRLTRALGTGRVTAISVAMTAAALFGFSVSNSFWMLCLWALPYGLGAGSVDAALNNYVALHFASRHMSWLHCMWGVGASIGPYIMGFALTGWGSWHLGYRIISVIQIVLAAAITLSLPLWKGGAKPDQASAPPQALTLRQTLAVPGVKAVIVTCFCYCAVEQTAGLWASSYLVFHKGLSPETAASLVGLFYIGITSGRAASGFLTMKLSDAQMVRLGEGIIAAGIAALLLPLGNYAAPVGLVLIGLGCAPIYPSVIHAVPARFGADKSQAVIGVQMAGAYVGNCLMPPLFGLVANHIGVSLFPFYLLAVLAVMVLTHEKSQPRP